MTLFSLPAARVSPLPLFMAGEEAAQRQVRVGR